MRCTDCEFMKETIPAQLRYVYCTKHKVEVPTWLEFDMKCQFKEHEESVEKMSKVPLINPMPYEDIKRALEIAEEAQKEIQ